MKELSLKISNPNKQIEKPIEVKSHFSEAKKRKLAKASMDFESLLTQMMLKSMTKSTGGLFGKEGYGSDIYNTLFETEISKYMSRSESMGVASMIYKKITGEELDVSKFRAEEAGGNLQNALQGLRFNSTESSGKTVAPPVSALKRLSKIEPIIEKASQKYDVSKSVLKSIILAESAARHDAVSSANAKGLMQLMDPTAAELGVKNVFDPEENIEGGTKYLASLLDKYDGKLDLALAAYNAGPDSVKKYNGIPPYKETVNYVNRIKNYINYFEMNHE